MNSEPDPDLDEYVCDECDQLSGRTENNALCDMSGTRLLCRHCYEESQP